MLGPMSYEHLEIDMADGVGWIWLNRPEKRNALSEDMWTDLPQAVLRLSDEPAVRSVVVAGRGPAFSVGIDLAFLAGLSPQGASPAVANRSTYRKIKELQQTMTAFAACPKPVIAAVHGYCLGAGIDLITACDIRLAASDATFGVRETRLGLVADVGTLQRLPQIIAPGHCAELVYTGRDIDAAEAARIGLVNRIYTDIDELMDGAGIIARQIAANSPLAVEGSKAVMTAGGGRSVTEALDYVALWNSAFLVSNDLFEGLAAASEKRPGNFTGT